MTSHRQKPSQTSHNKQLSVATLCLWSRRRDEICLLFPLFSFAPSSFPYDFSYLSFPSRWAGVLNEATTPAALGCTSKCCLKRAFLSFPLIFYPFHRPISFTLAFPSPLSLSTPFTSFNVFPRTLKCETERAMPLLYLNSSTPPCLSPSVHLSPSQPIVYLAIRLIMLSHLCN